MSLGRRERVLAGALGLTLPQSLPLQSAPVAMRRCALGRTRCAATE